MTIFTRKKKIRTSRKTCLYYRRQRKICHHIRALKKALNRGLKFKKVHKVIKFQQKAWLKSCIDIKNVRKHRDIKLVTAEEKRIKLVSEPNYHTAKHFSDNLLAIEMKKKDKGKNE